MIDGIWDESEWISWDHINSHLERAEVLNSLNHQYPHLKDYIDRDSISSLDELEQRAGQLEDILAQYPNQNPLVVESFQKLCESAFQYYKLQKRHLEIWGELGELFVEMKLGLRRYKPHKHGSDGYVGKDVIEVKTISPNKTNEIVEGHCNGNFNILALVKISHSSDGYVFELRTIKRKELNISSSNKFRINWKKVPVDGHPVLIKKDYLNYEWCY